MIKKSIFILFALFFVSQSSYACDVCGGSSSNLGLGLLTDYRSNIVRLGYFNTHFKSYNEQQDLIKDNFNQFALSFRYAINNKIRITAHVPYQLNSRKYATERLSESGLSDIRVIGSYVMLNNKPVTENSDLYMEAGVGLSLPTGNYDEDIHSRNLPINFNTGIGSLAYIFQLNSVWNLAEFGIVFNGVVQVNGETKSGYHYGNLVNTQLRLYKEFSSTKVRIIPNIGFSLENTDSDKYVSNNKVNGTGGSGLFLSTAISFRTDSWMAGFNYALPLMENYSEGEVSLKGRLSAQLSYIF